MNEIQASIRTEWEETVRGNIRKMSTTTLLGVLVAFKKNEMFGKNTPEDDWYMKELHAEVIRRGVKR